MCTSVLALVKRESKRTLHGHSYTTSKVEIFCIRLIVGGFGSLKKYNALYDSVESETVQSWYRNFIGSCSLRDGQVQMYTEPKIPLSSYENALNQVEPAG